jgi:hypothetical protein
MQANWSSIYNDDSCWIHPYSRLFFCRRRRRRRRRRGDVISLDHLGRQTWLAMQKKKKKRLSQHASQRKNHNSSHQGGSLYLLMGPWYTVLTQFFLSLSFSLLFFPQGRKGRSLAPSLDAIGSDAGRIFSHYLWNNKRLHLIVIDICAWGWWWCPHQKLMSCDITMIPLVSLQVFFLPSSCSFFFFIMFHRPFAGDFSLSAA